MKRLILTIAVLFFACNPVDVIEESKILMSTSKTLITVEYTSTIKQATVSWSFYVPSQYLEKVVEQYAWLQAYKSNKGYRCYCRSFTIKRDDNLVVVRFIGSPIGKEWYQDLIWFELISEKLYQEIMSYYEPIEHSYVNIYVGE